MSKELVEIVRCKNCIHRPTEYGGSPKREDGTYDNTCPLLQLDVCSSFDITDDFFCAEGEAKEER